MNAITAVAVLSTLVPAAIAGDPPVIGVRFELGEPAYRANFPDAPAPGADFTIAEFEAGLAQELACDLSKRIGFLQFSAAAPADAPTLNVALVGENAAPGSLLKATNLEVWLSRGVPVSERLFYAFRDPSDFNLPVGGRSFQDEVRDRFAEFLKDRTSDVVAVALETVPLTSNVYLFVGTDGRARAAVLPFRHADLCTLANTAFEVKFREPEFNSLDSCMLSALDAGARLPEGAAPDPLFERGILLRGDAIAKLGDTAGVLSIEGVFLRTYNPDPGTLAARECEVRR